MSTRRRRPRGVRHAGANKSGLLIGFRRRDTRQTVWKRLLAHCLPVAVLMWAPLAGCTSQLDESCAAALRLYEIEKNDINARQAAGLGTEAVGNHPTALGIAYQQVEANCPLDLLPNS